MKKKYLKIFGVIISIIILIGISYYNKFCNYYKSGENNNFELKVGETLEIRLYENGSTGFSNCWLNENRSKKLKLVNRKYENSLYAKLGSEGAGGIITLIFKAYEKGIDTIKIANCPLGQESKNCSDYNEKNTAADNEFIVKISER
ncbi:protease inhibitor I42 family protein [Flavobacterium celericrescens]|uniref:Protease inhibitor I42 family protein n=1 Tax=Flavobacterium celericrescens TaxID=2709780 RepID=A0ABX0ICT3_9FLAO|nr:protease inhibitor I42 family protein [Flavobacterium celericrescens]NHM03674.1 protease inhibitor I42 family protein [Flavobacterium celericrescens]